MISMASKARRQTHLPTSTSKTLTIFFLNSLTITSLMTILFSAIFLEEIRDKVANQMVFLVRLEDSEDLEASEDLERVFSTMKTF